ncbi:MAG: hypothetical protein KIT20_00100 [Alphaproteobacteria bacterium]|nr:hypothetical protein [Alphaproteobacteria bacterium]
MAEITDGEFGPAARGRQGPDSDGRWSAGRALAFMLMISAGAWTATLAVLMR